MTPPMVFDVYVEPQQGASYDTLLRVARAAEALGYHGFFRSDHLVRLSYRDGLSGAIDYAEIPPGLAPDERGLPGPTEAWVSLAGLARETSVLRLGTLVSPVTFRAPGLLAMQVAQVDAMSGGRVELGLGAGWFLSEHTAYGIPFPTKRFALLEEQLEIIIGIWETDEGDNYSFAGEHHQLRECPALPKPVQHPHPPIILGGNGPRRLPRLVANYADEYNADFRSPSEAAAGFSRVRDACLALGRDPRTVTMSYSQVVCCGAVEREVAERAHAIGRDADELRANALAGTPGEIVHKLGELREIGTQRVYLALLDLSDLDHLELIASEIIRQV